MDLHTFPWFEVAAITLLIFVSAFFSGSETALTAASRARLHQHSRRGNRRADMVSDLKDHSEQLIGAILIGEGDLGQELGFPRQYEHPALLDAMAQIVDICKRHDTIVGHPHATPKNMQRVIDDGYRFLMAAPERSYADLELGLSLTGRK